MNDETLLLRAIDAAEPLLGPPPRVARTHARGDVLRGAHLEMEAQLVVDIATGVRAPESQIAAPGRRPPRRRHAIATVHSGMGGASSAANTVREARPRCRLDAELRASLRRQRVVLRSTIVLRRAPLRFDPPARLQPVQRRIERAFL